MIQTFQGHFKEDGQFVAGNNVVKIPTYRRVIINVLDEIIDTETNQLEKEIVNRLKMVESITGIIPPDIDIEAIKAERISKRGLLE